VDGILGVEKVLAKPCKVAEDVRAICRTTCLPIA